jgi:hypothetical protein
MALVPLTSNFMPLQPCNAKSDLSASRYSTWWAMRRGDLSTDKVRSKSCLKERSVSPRTHLFGDTPASITTLTRCVENIQGVPLACDLARSGSNPGDVVFQVKKRQPVYDCCAADRERARLPQRGADSLELPQRCERANTICQTCPLGRRHHRQPGRSPPQTSARTANNGPQHFQSPKPPGHKRKKPTFR